MAGWEYGSIGTGTGQGVSDSESISTHLSFPTVLILRARLLSSPSPSVGRTGQSSVDISLEPPPILLKPLTPLTLMQLYFFGP